MTTDRRTHYSIFYTRKNAQVATDLQIRTACSEFFGTSLKQAVDKL